MALSDGLAYFSVKGHGTKAAWAEAIETGISINGDETQSRHHTTFYPREVTGSSFLLSVSFTTHRQWREFNEWLMDYGRKLAEGGLGPMTVSIAARNFRRLGIPTKGFAYGDEVGATVRRSTIRFDSTTDPLAPGAAGTSSEPWLPKDSTVRQFYPTGNQLSTLVADEALHDDTQVRIDFSKAYAEFLRNQGGG